VSSGALKCGADPFMDQHLRYENQRQSCEVTDLLAAIAKCQLCFPGLVSKDVPRQEPLRGKTRSERRDNFLFLYGIDVGEARTLEEVGAQYELTRERVRQIEVKALRKLKAQGTAARYRGIEPSI
jgi:hypothetical protein